MKAHWRWTEVNAVSYDDDEWSYGLIDSGACTNVTGLGMIKGATMPDDCKVKLRTAQGTLLKRHGKVKVKLRLGGHTSDQRQNIAAVDFHVTDVQREPAG